MRRRRRRGRAETTSLDSFLDVVCNLVAGLLLVSLITALAARNKVFDVIVPVEQEAAGTLPVDFVVTPAGLYPLDPSEAVEKLKKNAVRDSRGGERSSAETRYFQWGLSSSLSLLVCRLKDKPPPVTEKNMSRVLDQLNAMKRKDRSGKGVFAFFFVSPDDRAFRLFRLARKELWDKGVRVGWAPSNPRQGIAFGAGGRLIQPQN